VRVVEP